ncbi:hypothetical protein SODALDRAFT_357928 [Sodiomyces alkalinus F11]|uniref:Uncharacterized protein n=1 Tax=Sodiomyces alkalinus (strain CBS 110278 / VKM F-3762 / F11) TaxID=1314773 RepID=A0A3N2PYF8_SODAK|nr:hypothetical protein SODALDRAFT_357928 [Sodiomyces alkalinus F11]ROT39524.1 hypothetical protein SODALDRAFT_357928 [Sodiomyces alkalinus F11]
MTSYEPPLWRDPPNHSISTTDLIVREQAHLVFMPLHGHLLAIMPSSSYSGFETLATCLERRRQTEQMNISIPPIHSEAKAYVPLSSALGTNTGTWKIQLVQASHAHEVGIFDDSFTLHPTGLEISNPGFSECSYRQSSMQTGNQSHYER